ncbi:7370_t:CDS:2 [Acaulospora morrowiae]|uniref:7370_t:CDS:1 n=1 Tax=Acaulospora morrowiae TaxID=94023 RepID=A0A9N9AYI6_9GLOM|nr:7370_t:CDS:2 [Acaulospora morrowiae]
MDSENEIRYDFTNPLLNRVALRMNLKADREFNDQDNRLRKVYKIINEKLNLKNEEKVFFINWMEKWEDENRISNESGIKRKCIKCYGLTFAKKNCEHCIRNYLVRNFTEWTSGNGDVDILIQNCQRIALRPDYIVEWIPYENLGDFSFLGKGGWAEVYKATWFDGRFDEWDADEQQLRRIREKSVALKTLDSLPGSNHRWFREIQSHLNFMMKTNSVVKCYGLTRNVETGNFMLVLEYMTKDLRKFMEESPSSLHWEEKIEIIYDITYSIMKIHEDKAGLIHGDLHPGNILQGSNSKNWYIGDLGFCRPAVQESNEFYGEPRYVSPEVIRNKEVTQASDIYSIGMIIWQVTTGRVPYEEYTNEISRSASIFLERICEGLRPQCIPGLPPEYKEIMERCLHNDPSLRPKARELFNFFEGQLESIYRGKWTTPELENDIFSDDVRINHHSSENLSSHIFGNLSGDSDILPRRNRSDSGDHVYVNGSIKYIQNEDGLLVMQFGECVTNHLLSDTISENLVKVNSTNEEKQDNNNVNAKNNTSLQPNVEGRSFVGRCFSYSVTAIIFAILKS